METRQLRIDEIMRRAGAIEDPGERYEFIWQQCGDDDSLRHEIEVLLAGTTAGESPLSARLTVSFAEGSTPHDRSVGAPLELRAGQSIAGRFLLRQKLGEGGMGEVWEAEQTQPVHRDVALKVIRSGLDSRRMLTRFDQERQVLARMEHPNIATVLDAGVDELGRPFFVMELIKGVPLTRYCNNERLTPRQRIELFITVCQAVQHAHQKGIIHRDLKPSNLLVSTIDGVAITKVIDFGVAKATGPQLAQRDVRTQVGSLVGTLEYMSPEQADLSNLDIDTRSDVYALGIVLYEILTNTVPFSRQELPEGSLTEMLRRIKETDPERPSTKLGASRALSKVAQAQGMEAKKLLATIKGELDWIVLKCLEKDRARRYATANDLAADLRRYLANEPVTANPPSWRYRAAKFVRRNRGAVAAASIILLLLVAGVIGTSIGLARAEAARLKETAATRTAESKAAEALAVLLFVEDKILAAARPKGQEGGLGREVTLRQALEAAVPYVETHFKDQPLVEARLRMTLGKSLEILDEHRQALPQFQRAHEIFAQQLGPHDPSTLDSMNHEAISQFQLNNRDVAGELFEQTLTLRRATLGPLHPDTLESQNNAANYYHAVDRQEEAYDLFTMTLQQRKQVLGIDNAATLTTMFGLAAYEEGRVNYETALALHKEVLERRRALLGKQHPDSLRSMQAVGRISVRLNRLPEALAQLEPLYVLQGELIGPDHLNTINTMGLVAYIYGQLQRREDELAILQDAVARLQKKRGPVDETAATYITNLCRCYHQLGRHEEGLKLSEESLAAERVARGLDEPPPGILMETHATGLSLSGRPAEALPLFEKVLEDRKQQLGENHPMTFRSLATLATTYGVMGKIEEAVRLLEESLERQRTALPRGHLQTYQDLARVADFYAELSHYDKVIAAREEILERQSEQLGLDNPAAIATANYLAWTLATVPEPALRNPARAVELANRATSKRPQIPTYWGTQGVARYRLGEWQVAIEDLKKAMEMQQREDGDWPAEAYFMAMAYWQLKEPELAQTWLEKADHWIEEFKSPNSPSPELLRFQAEARQLIRSTPKEE